MRRIALIGIAILSTALSAAAQEVTLHGSSALWNSDALRHGVGLSISGSMRLGDLFVDSSMAARSNLRVGMRASITESRFADRTGSFFCADDCAPGANDVSVSARTTQVTVNVLPYVSVRTRVEINGGVAVYRQDRFLEATGSSFRESQWGFVTSASVSRRFNTSPMWLYLAMTRHAEVLQMADGSFDTPRHSFVAGLTYRFADRQRASASGRD